MVDLEALRELAWSGIPAELRPACWQLLLGYLPPNRERRCAGLPPCACVAQPELATAASVVAAAAGIHAAQARAQVRLAAPACRCCTERRCNELCRTLL